MTKNTGRLRWAFLLNLFLATVELIGGYSINSLAIISNAMHDFVDAFTLGLGWKLESVSTKGKDSSFSYGYRRFSVLAAIINATILTLVTIYILFEAVDRWYHPQPVDSHGIIYFALLGVVINVASVLLLRSGNSLNEKLMTLELTGDAISWVVVLLTSLINLFYQIPSIDTILSVLIAIYIFVNVIINIRYLAKIFLQGTPDKKALEQIKTRILKFPEIDQLHDVHLWSLDGEFTIFTAHVILHKDIAASKSQTLKSKIRNILNEFQVNHSTLEIEFGEETAPQI